MLEELSGRCTINATGMTSFVGFPKSQEVKVDDGLQVQLTALRGIVKDLKSEIVKELELVMQRELSSNLQEVKAALKALHHVSMTDINLDLPLDPDSGKPRLHNADSIHLAKKRVYGEANEISVSSLEDISNLQETSRLHEASVTYREDEILKAVTRRHTDTLNHYLHNKLDPNHVLYDIKLPFNSKPFTHCSVLALAVLAGRASHVNLLLNMKASIDNSTYGFLAGACQLPWSGPVVTATLPRNNQAMLQLLLDKKADIAAEASNGANFIWQCAYFGKHELLKMCLQSTDVSEQTLGKPAEYQNQDGISYSPLHISVLMGQESCSRLLLAAKAPVDLENEENETPLGTAIKFCRPELVTLLVKEGALITEVERPSIRSESTTGSTLPAAFHGKLSLPAGLKSKLHFRSRFSSDNFGDLKLKEGVVRLFAKKERNPVLVHAVAVGLQSQPEQVEALTPRAILEFWCTDTTCMAAMLEAMFAERHLRFRGKTAAKEIRECKTAIVVKSERLKNNSLYRHPIVVSSQYRYCDIVALEKSGGAPDENIMKFARRLAPQHLRDFKLYQPHTSSSILCEHRHVPIGVYECLVPSIHHDLRFLKIIANIETLDPVFLNPHCQAIIAHSWVQSRIMAVVSCFVHFMLLAFFAYIAVNRNHIGVNELHPGMLEYAEIRPRAQWAAVLILPSWFYELGVEGIEFVAHVQYGWAMEYLTDSRNLLDDCRIVMDGVIIFSFIFAGFRATEDIYFRSFLGAVCALKWTKMLYCLTPFRKIGLQVIPILYTLNNIIPCVAITFVYFSGLAHGFVALDVLPHGFSFTVLRSAMFAASGSHEDVEEMNNPENRDDFESWWLQLILVLATFFLPITFMNIFIAAMSLSYQHGIDYTEQLYQKRCVDASFSHACVSYAFKKRWGRGDDGKNRLWYCRDSSED